MRAAKRVAGAVGVDILDLSDGSEVYVYNGEKPFITASNTKLFTTAAALVRLGPGFYFETEVLARGQVGSHGWLDGDLAIVGSGDPNLSGRQYFGDAFGAFREWAAALAAHGVRGIRGDLVLVHGLFDDQRIHPSWPRDQLDRWYEAPIDALSFNDNCLLVKVMPAGRSGAPARIESVPRLERFPVRSSATTVARVRAPLRFGRAIGATTITVGGEISRRSRSVDRWVSVPDPVRYFGEALRAALAEEGIAIGGRLRPVVHLPAATWWRVRVHRNGLLPTLEIINKRSQNFYAESLLKTLGAHLCGDGSWRGGLRAIGEVLAELGLEPGSYRMADGSGMSRNNRFSPRQITRLLAAMEGHRWGDVYLRTLPVSGERGLSWQKRLADAPYRGNVVAKTGTLRGVSALSGYAKGRSGRRYAFSILLNRAPAHDRSVGAEDAIVRALIDHG